MAVNWRINISEVSSLRLGYTMAKSYYACTIVINVYATCT